MSKLKSTKKPNPHARHIVIPVRVNSIELRELFKKAHQWTGGNMSEFFRAATEKWKPSKEDFEK